jgi:diadenosine tetraphosphate (Ap4A) HIT family hydrolase
MTAPPDTLPHSHCYLCDIVRDGIGHPYRTVFPRSLRTSEVIAESTHFIAVLDIAPVIEGYLLVFPRAHEIALSQSPFLEELGGFVAMLSHVLERCYGTWPQLFEHGSTGMHAARGCCIEHAHLHLVPYAGVILPPPDQSQFRTISGLQDLSTAHPDQDYLYLRDNTGQHLLWETDTAPQQYFRRQLARSAGVNLWNWLDYVLLSETSGGKQRIIRAARRLKTYLEI